MIKKLFTTYVIIILISFLIIVGVDEKINAKMKNHRIDEKVLINKMNKLPEDYEPDDLVLLDKQYSTKDVYVRKMVVRNLKKMISNATEEGLNLKVASGYRTKEYQVNLYKNYVKNVGYESANRFSAKPRYSEHELGLAVDVVGENNSLDYFNRTKEYDWIKDNCYKYGFILRYPKGKEKETGYMFEPWHYRYLGKSLAKKVYKSKLSYEEYYKKN